MLTGNYKGGVGGKPKSDIGQYGLRSKPKADGWQGLTDKKLITDPVGLGW